jgi:hypothetical protein
VLRGVATLICADGTLKPTTAIRRLIGDDNPSAIRRLQVKWKRDKPIYLNEAGHMEAEQYDPVRHANAPKNALVRVNANNPDHWNKIGLAGWSQVQGLPNGEWIMRRDFPQGFVPPEDMPKFLEQCLKLMGDIPNDLCLRNPLY